jgi:L-lactate dehydrogenase complex protein LldF
MTPEADVLRRFEDRSRRQLRKTHLPLIIGRATDTREARRRQGFAGLDMEGLRRASEAVRTHTLANLDTYLDRFATAAEARGTKVFFAATGEEAVDYIRRVVAGRDCRLVVKGKSMASEEIGLAHALEADGVEVLETDLGEYIVQLAHEPPSHITAPAVHKTRGEIAELLGSRHGRTLPDDPETLTAFAREVLRGSFLRAEVGISGVNFGVADSGSLALVENEGNGRMVTSLPPVHIAIMGAERIVPSFRELGLMLPMLVTSASGRPVTTYFSFINGPRLAEEVDGPEEVHVVVLDNGRSRILGTEFRSILNCIRCGACQNVCPVYRHVGGHAYGSVYGGPIGAVLTPLLVGFERAGDLPHASSLCGACTEVCPVGIPLHEHLLALRREVARHRGRGAEALVMRAWSTGWRRAWRYRLLAIASRVGQRLFVRRGRIRSAPLPFSRWTLGRDLPPVARRTFRERWARGDGPAAPGGTGTASERRPTPDGRE